jgi:hypothetical protein
MTLGALVGGGLRRRAVAVVWGPGDIGGVEEEQVEE